MTTPPIQRSQHPYHMHDMILGQPNAIARVLQEESSSIEALAQALESTRRVHVVGIGTSWHAALVGEFALRAIGGRDEARAWNSFEFCSYPPNLTSEDAVIVMSHRGTKRYSAQALELAKSAGAQTAVFTGIGSDARTDLADFVVRTSTSEMSSAFTISHTAAMTGLITLATEVGIRSEIPDALALQQPLKGLPELVKAALEHEQAVRDLAREFKDSERFYFVGWGPNASTAYEVALKIKESSYLVTEGLQLEQYLHGPFVATHKGCVATFVVPSGVGHRRSLDLIGAVNETGATSIAIAEQDDGEVEKLAGNMLSMLVMPEILTPIAYLVTLQLFTYWLAVESGRNPDTFRLDDPNHQAAKEHYQL